MNENLKKISNSLNIGLSTLYKWKNDENRKVLYDFIIENFERNSSTIKNIENIEILEYFNKLTEDEQRMYKSEMEVRILRKNLDKAKEV